MFAQEWRKNCSNHLSIFPWNPLLLAREPSYNEPFNTDSARCPARRVMLETQTTWCTLYSSWSFWINKFPARASRSLSSNRKSIKRLKERFFMVNLMIVFERTLDDSFALVLGRPLCDWDSIWMVKRGNSLPWKVTVFLKRKLSDPVRRSQDSTDWWFMFTSGPWSQEKKRLRGLKWL